MSVSVRSPTVRTTTLPVSLLLALLAAGAGPVAAQAVPTDLVVRVLAHDAKIIGSGVGGARITVRDARTGGILASGIQEGGTGNTDVIMRTPWERGGTLFDMEGTGSWRGTLELDGPTWIEVVAEGPLGFEEAVQRGSKTLLMVPGRDVVGEGLVIELNGFTVVIDEVSAQAERTFDVRAKVTMLCGCPTEPGGLWDSDRFEVVARLVLDGRPVIEVPLSFAGETSYYAGTITAPDPGEYELQVLAMDPDRANNGMARRRVTVLY